MYTKFFLLLVALSAVLLVGCIPVQATPSTPALGQEGGATIAISPLPDTQSQKVLLTGVGFIPDMALSIRIGAPQTGLNQTDLARIESDSKGGFTVEIVLPEVWPGTNIPLIEEVIVLAAIDPILNQTLATVTYQQMP